MAALRTEKPVLRSPAVAASGSSVTITNASKSHILSDSSGLGHNNNSDFLVNSATSNLAAEFASSANGGFALASALAGILGLTFPTTLLTTTTNTSFNNKSINNSTSNAYNSNTASITNNNSNTIHSHTNVSNWLSASNPDPVETVDSVARNHCKSPETASSITSIPEQFSVPLPTSIFPIDSNMLSFPFPLPVQQTCSDVSSDTGSAQSPFTPQQIGPSSTGLGHGQSDTHQSNVSLKFGSDAFGFESNSPFLTAAERDRKQREFIPESKKDDKYWERRRKNNEAAKRSREKRRQNDIMMECRINELNAQNQKLRQELIELKLRFEVPLNDEERNIRDNLYSTSPAVFNGMSDSDYKCFDTLSQPDSGTPKPKNDNLDSFRNGSKHQSVSPFLSVNGNQTTGDSVIRLNEIAPLTTASSIANSDRNGSLPSQLLSASFLSPPLNSLNNTDLIAVKRIFSNLVAASGAGGGGGGVSVVTASNPNPGPIPATATTILSNPLLDNSVTPTSALTNLSLNSPSCAVSVALLLQQAGLLQQSNPIVDVQKLFNLQDSSVGSSGDLTSSGPVSTTATNVPCSTKLALVSPTQSETMTWSDCADSPLDLSLCLRVKSNTNTIDSQLSDSPSNYEPQVLDKRYQDRRRRNNEAVRRCRENKRARLLGGTGASCNTVGVSSGGNAGPDVDNASSEPGDKLETENRALRHEVRALRKLLLVGPPNSCDQVSSESPTSESQLVSTTHGLDENAVDSADSDQKMSVESTTAKVVPAALNVSTGYSHNGSNDNPMSESPTCLSATDVISNKSSPQPLSESPSSLMNEKHADLLDAKSRVSDSSNTITPSKDEAVSCTGDENNEPEDSGQHPISSTPKQEPADIVEADLRPATNGPRLGHVRGRRRISKPSANRILSRHSTDLDVPSTTLSGTYFHKHEYSQNSGKEDGVVS